jgi:hypothetical protein
MDYLALADALALRYATPVPPAGLKAITGSTARPPNNIPNTPFVIAWAQQGDVEYLPGQRKGEHEFQVVFYHSKSEADVPREYTALLKWLGVLLDCTNGQMQLGLAGSVLKAIPMKWEIGSVVYAGDQYEVITLTVHVWTTEAVTLVP